MLYNSQVKSLSRVQLFATRWTIDYQSPLSMEFSRQGYWSRLPFPSPGIEPGSPALQADTLPSESPGKPVLYNKTLFNHSVYFASASPKLPIQLSPTPALENHKSVLYVCESISVL